MVSFMKKQLLIFNSVVNFMLSFKIRCNIKFLQAKCNSYWVQKVSLCRFFFVLFCYFKAAQSLQRMLLKLKSSMVIQISFLHRINRYLRKPPSAFSSVYLWSGTDTTLFILQSLTLPADLFQKLPRLWLSPLVASEQIGWTWPFLSKRLSILRAVNTAWH